MSEKEAGRLNQRHDGKRYADRSGGLGVQLPDKHRIRHIIERSDQHTDDCWDRHLPDQLRNRCSRQILHLFILGKVFEFHDKLIPPVGC